MILLPIISIVMCLAYIIFIVLKYGVPVSLSETYYILPNKWDWMFAAWTVLTSLPFSIYWFQSSPDNLKWIPVVVGIALLMIGVSSCYKSGPKKEYPDKYTGYLKCGDNNLEPIWVIWDNIKTKWASGDLFKYGWLKIIHFINALIVIILSTVYVIIHAGSLAIISTILSYLIFIVIGARIGGVYNEDYSADIDNKTWIFFMEVVCILNLFIFVW